MKNILIINEGHTSNLGDKLLNQVMVELMKKNRVINEKYVPIETDESMEKGILVGPTPGIVNFKNKVIGRLGLTLFFNDIKYKRLIKKRIKNKQFDLAIIGGGELISDNANFNSAFYNWVTLLYEKNIPIIVTGVSGNKPDEKMSKRYKEALELCDLVSVRDKSTQKLFEEAYGIRVQYIPDYAFLYKKLSGKAENYKKDNSVTAQIYCLHYLPQGTFKGTEEEYYQMWIKLIQKNMMNAQTEIKLSYTNKEDRDYTRTFYQYCVEQEVFDNISLVETDSIEKYVELVKSTSAIITGRMHAMILAMLYGNELKPYVFKEKIHTFQKEWIESGDSVEEAVRQIESFVDEVKTKWELE